MQKEQLVKIHTIKPKGYTHSLEVVACYLKKDDKYLFLKKSKGRNEEKTWGVAGGRVEINEDPKKANIREVFEETGIQIHSLNLRFERVLFVENPYYGKYLLHIYSYSCPSTQIVTLSDEHEEYRWLSLEDAKKLPLLLGGLQSLSLFEEGLFSDT